jgi:SAM-dependent methyltransferase
VVGIEPLDAMRQVAQASHPAPHVYFHAGVAQQTGLPDGAADIVTCAQSLHDMEPQSTLAEVARILRGGGVFAAYDDDWPPVLHWEAEQALCTFTNRISALWQQYAITDERQQWAKHAHLERMWCSGHLRYVKELFLHHTESCSAERWGGFALTLGHVLPVLDLGLSEAESGLEALRQVAEQTLGDQGLPWYVSYRVRVGVE